VFVETKNMLLIDLRDVLNIMGTPRFAVHMRRTIGYHRACNYKYKKLHSILKKYNIRSICRLTVDQLKIEIELIHRSVIDKSTVKFRE